MGQKFVQPAGILQPCCCKIFYAGLEVLPVSFDAAEGDFVAEHKTEIDFVGGDLELSRTTGDAHHGENAVFRKHVHGFENKWGIPRAFENQIEWAVLRRRTG